MARRDGQVAALDETLIWATAGDLARALNAEELSAADLVASLLKRSDVVGDETGYFLHNTN